MKSFNHLETPQLEELKSETTENGRHYFTPTGEKYPSVTTVTGHEKKKFFKEWRKNNPEESKRVLRRGNKFHSIIEDYLQNKEVSYKDVDANSWDLFEQAIPLLDNIDNIVAQEVPLWSNTLMLAGRVDCLAEYNGVLSVVDFKGSTRKKKKSNITEYFMQSTAYAIMWQERTGQVIEQIVILISNEDGEIQEFVANPLDYCDPLRQCINKYWVERKGNHDNSTVQILSNGS
jgi:genome maintenance exonuclease 1|tara:strand:+ start:560 stop:1255 length:696 start_codon:yes stop_codon:yes gene_type:complete